MKPLARLLLFLAPVIFLAANCEKTGPESDSMDFRMSVTSTRTVKAGTVVKTSFQPGKGPLESDLVLLKGEKSFEYKIHDLTSDSFCFTIGSDFVSGSYAFCIKRGGNVKEIANVNYTMQSSDLQAEGDANVFGKVMCDGTGVAGVLVSDGYEIVKTNSQGIYSLKSEKKNSYVYITVPSGYEVASKKNYSSQAEGILPLFWKKLTQGRSTAERVDFTLYKVSGQDNYKVLFLGDMHLAGGKEKDLTQFARFKTEANEFASTNASQKIYAFTLGDMTWDLYWYTRNYGLVEYLSTMEDINGIQIFHTIGNHDHNMQTSATPSGSDWSGVDWDTAGKFRSILGPNYYSVNIGKIHYIVLDNIYCKNTTGGAGEDRHHYEEVAPETLEWLKKDLSYVSKSTPVIVTMHAPLYKESGSNNMSNSTALANCFAGYSDVRFITGHTHKMWNVDKSAIHENNSGAVCGAWWWAGSYCQELNIAQDGAPAGYRIMDVKGTTTQSTFKGTGRNSSEQFRSYDRNSIRINIPLAANYGGYDTTSSDNYVLINVWDYSKDWKIEVKEKETEKNLEVSVYSTYDPLYILTYIVNRYPTETSESKVNYGPYKTAHMFRVKASSSNSTLEIKVTDDEGTVYTETMNRPKAFNIETYK